MPCIKTKTNIKSKPYELYGLFLLKKAESILGGKTMFQLFAKKMNEDAARPCETLAIHSGRVNFPSNNYAQRNNKNAQAPALNCGVPVRFLCAY